MPEIEREMLVEAAKDLTRDTREGSDLATKLKELRVLSAKLEELGVLGSPAYPERERTTDEIRRLAADTHTLAAGIVARAVTEKNHRREFEEALLRWQKDPPSEGSPLGEQVEQHPHVATIREMVRGMLAEAGRDLITELALNVLMEMVLPGSSVLLLPTNFVAAVLEAITLGSGSAA